MAGSRRLTALSQSSGDRAPADPDDHLSRGTRLFPLPEGRSIRQEFAAACSSGSPGPSCGPQIPQLPCSTRTRRPAPPPADDEPTPDDDVPAERVEPLRRKGLPPLAPESTSSSVESGMSMSDNEPQSPRQRTPADGPFPAATADDVVLPEFSYPAPVKNTFIDYPVARPPSLEEFYEERQVKSAPTSGVQDPVLVLPKDGPLQRTAVLSWTGFGAGAEGAPSSFAAPAPAVVYAMSYAGEEMVPIAPIGSEACPTMGSIGHPYGRCKPCAFMWKGDGCKTDATCPFCHLCDAGEKKRRRKEKIALRRGVGRLSRNLACVLNFSGSPR